MYEFAPVVVHMFNEIRFLVAQAFQPVLPLVILRLTKFQYVYGITPVVVFFLTDSGF